MLVPSKLRTKRKPLQLCPDVRTQIFASAQLRLKWLRDDSNHASLQILSMFLYTCFVLLKWACTHTDTTSNAEGR